MSSTRILIADDDPAVLDAVGAVLATDGYEIETALDGAEALKRVLDAPRLEMRHRRFATT